MTPETERHGSCLCGAVEITLKVTGTSVAACHCSMCRKWGSGPFLAIECEGGVRFDGDDDIAVFRSSEWAERGFCRRCGSHLFYRLKDVTHYAIPVGLLDDREQWSFDQQIFIEEKPSFYSFANETKNLTGAEVFAQHGASPQQE